MSDRVERPGLADNPVLDRTTAAKEGAQRLYPNVKNTLVRLRSSRIKAEFLYHCMLTIGASVDMDQVKFSFVCRELLSTMHVVFHMR